MNTAERFPNLDGLRAISCVAIIGMHIRANSNYVLPSWTNTVIASWTLFVYLFLMISGFGMFCGYYNRFKNGTIDLNSFYTKRYKKIFPFFALLIVIDLVVERSLSHVIEGVTELTLVFGLLPNNQLDVIGVSWTLGVIFLFYMLFPFFVFLCWNKKRALISTIVSMVLNLLCSNYFFTEKFVGDSFIARHNFLYCAPYFLCGGLLYLYRKEIKEFVTKHKWICLFGCLSTIVILYSGLACNIFSMNDPGIWMIIIFFPWLAYAIGTRSKILSNRVMNYLSGISLELYLAQMLIFRIVEKANCQYLLGNGFLSFILTWIFVIAGLIAFIQVYRWSIGKIKKWRMGRGKP